MAPTALTRIAAFLESASKVALLASTGFAMAGEVTLGFRYHPALAWVLPGILICSFLGGRFRLATATWPLLASAFLVPALLRLVMGPFAMYHVVWYAALFGLIASDRGLLQWHVPISWRPWLACWALVIAFSWPIVVGRELDWDLSHLYEHAIVVSGMGGIARNEVDWIFSVVTLYGLGLLWLDWLFSVYASEAEFRRTILSPLAVSWIIAMLVGVYQMTIDPTLFAPGFWVVLKRVTGPLLDANGFGMVAALWGVPLAALALSRLSAWRFVAALAMVALSFAGVWGSGSRNAFVVALCGTAALVAILFRIREFAAVRARIAIGFGVVAALLVTIIVFGQIAAIGPLHRIWEVFHGSTVGQLFYQFWDRGPYGSAGFEAIRRWPVVGTGIGTFHTLVGDIWFRAGHDRLPLDNAQSWYRHQFAELGVLGSVGWLVWLTLVCAAILSPIRQSTDSLVIRATRMMLVLLGVVELVGIPTQVFAVAFSFLTILAWHISSRQHLPPAFTAFRWPPYVWIGVWSIALLHVALTVDHARGDLRVPHRAVWANFAYEDGFYPASTTDMQPGQGRFTQRHAVAVLEATMPVVRVSVRLPYVDAHTPPVHVDVWVNGQHSINQRVWNRMAIVRYVPVQPGTRFLIETDVSRTFQLPQDDRQVGLAIQWQFVNGVPD